MSLLAVADAFRRQAGEVSALTGATRRAAGSIEQATRAAINGPNVTVTVGPGGDRSAENYARFFTRLQGGGVGDSAVDAQAVANYLSFFTMPNVYLEIFRVLPGITLPGYGIDPRATLRRGPEPARGLRI